MLRGRVCQSELRTRCSIRALASLQESRQLCENRVQPIHDDFVQFSLQMELMIFVFPGEAI
jgi:hypothetical protein